MTKFANRQIWSQSQVLISENLPTTDPPGKKSILDPWSFFSGLTIVRPEAPAKSALLTKSEISHFPPQRMGQKSLSSTMSRTTFLIKSAPESLQS